MMHEKNEVKWNCFIATSSISPIEFTARKNNLDCSKIPIDENTTFILLWVKDAQIGDRAVISMKKLSHSPRLQGLYKITFPLGFAWITLMGSICWDWRAGNRILHFFHRLWRIWTSSTNASHDLFWRNHPCAAVCCPKRMLCIPQQMLPMRMGH